MGEYQRKLRARLKAKGTSPKKALMRSADNAPAKPDFMTSRRMFAVVDGEVRVASLGDRRFHREWLIDVDQDRFDRLTRGYYLAPDLVAYRRGFETVSSRDLVQQLPAIKAAMDLPDDTRVYNGAHPAEAGSDDLVGSNLMGTLSEMLLR